MSEVTTRRSWSFPVSQPNMRRLAAWSLLFAPSLLGAQAFDFSIRNMMRGPELYGREPVAVRWTADGQWIYFNWLPAGSDWRAQLKPYRVRAQQGASPEAVTEAHMDSVGPVLGSGLASPDRTRRIAEYRGDLYIVDVKSARARPLTATVASESAARWSSDGRQVLFVRDGNAFALSLADGLERQLTDIRAAGAAGAGAGVRAGGAGASRTSGQRGALERDQRNLFEVIRDTDRADSIRRVDSTARAAVGIKPVMLAAGERLAQLSVSPAASAALFTTTTGTSDARNGIVPNYVTTSGYTEDIPNRTKVGDAQPATRLGYQSLPRGDVRWLRSIDSDSLIANSQVVSWNEAGTHALVVGSSRNFKTRQYSVVDAATGSLRAIEVLRDTAWVGGPCGFGCAGFYDGGRRVYWVSEATGFAQLWSAAVDGSDKRQLTTGNFEIYDVRLSNDGRWFHFHSSEVSAFDRDLWRMAISGGARTKLTPEVGGHQVVLSPNEEWMADVYSRTNRPPELLDRKSVV